VGFAAPFTVACTTGNSFFFVLSAVKDGILKAGMDKDGKNWRAGADGKDGADGVDGISFEGGGGSTYTAGEDILEKAKYKLGYEALKECKGEPHNTQNEIYNSFCFFCFRIPNRTSISASSSFFVVIHLQTRVWGCRRASARRNIA